MTNEEKLLWTYAFTGLLVFGTSVALNVSELFQSKAFHWYGWALFIPNIFGLCVTIIGMGCWLYRKKYCH